MTDTFKIEHHAPSTCPACGATWSAAILLDPEVEGGPEPGDFTVCHRCDTPLRYTEGLRLRRVTLRDRRDMTVEIRVTIEEGQRFHREWRSLS